MEWKTNLSSLYIQSALYIKSANPVEDNEGNHNPSRSHKNRNNSRIAHADSVVNSAWCEGLTYNVQRSIFKGYMQRIRCLPL